VPGKGRLLAATDKLARERQDGVPRSWVDMGDVGSATEAAYQYLVTALQLGATPETTAEINQRLATIESEEKLHVGRLPRRMG